MNTVTLDLFESQFGGRERRAYEVWWSEFMDRLPEVESREDFVLLSARCFPEEDPALWWEEAEANATTQLDWMTRFYPDYTFETVVLVEAVGNLIRRYVLALAFNQGGHALLQEVTDAIDHGLEFRKFTMN